MNAPQLEQFTNWLLQEIAGSATRSLVVRARNVPNRLGMAPQDVDDALKALREQCVIACTNGRWWARDPRAHRPPAKVEPKATPAAPAPKRKAAR